MSISFNEVPSSIRVPFMYAEFDNSRAIQGSGSQPYTALIIGQKLSTGADAELVPAEVTSAAQAQSKYGEGSQLHHMVKAFKDVNPLMAVTCVAIDDLLAGVEATGKIDLGAAQAATADGIYAVYHGGRRYQVAVSSGDDQDAIATAMAAEINADTLRFSDAAVNGVNAYEVDLTCRHKGVEGSYIDTRINYYSDDELPAGVTAPTITAMASGAGNPDIQEVIDVLDDTQYIGIIHPWTDAANLAALKTELDDRNGPLRQVDGMAITARTDTFANQTTLGESRNDRFLTVMSAYGPDHQARWAAAYGARLLQAAEIDSARTSQTLTLPGILAPEKSERRRLEENNLHLYDGLSTFSIDASDTVQIQRAITTYRLNGSGGADESYLDCTTFFNLSFIRYDFRTSFLQKYPRHKLADDGNNYSSGQPIMTPTVGKAFAVSKFQQWLEDGKVENSDQFINDLIVERSSSDVNRLDFLMSPDLINSLIVGAAKFAFLL